jgi:hypothetical protein
MYESGKDFIQDASKTIKKIYPDCKVLSEQFNDAAFGNSCIIFKAEKLLIRCIMDRGQIFIEFASSNKPDEWHYLENLVKEIDGTDIGVLSLNEYEEIILKYKNKIKDFF